jgi:hypothetical protein
MTPLFRRVAPDRVEIREGGGVQERVGCILRSAAAEQRVHDAYAKPGSSSPTIGLRTERMLTALPRLAQGHGITIKTKQGLTTFGHGLADEEIRYVHALVRDALVGLS